MPRLFLAIAALILPVWLSGCATLSKIECETGDWRAIGVSDGYHGYEASRFERHVEACDNYGVTPSHNLYLAGYNEGLADYCHLDRAAEVGIDGDPYHQVCIGELGLSFGRVYLQGRDVHRVRESLANTRFNIDTLERKLMTPGLAPDTRDAFEDQLSDLEDIRDDLEGDLDREQYELRQTLANEMRRLNALGIEG